MKHVEITINDGHYKAIIKQESNKSDLVVAQTIDAASDIEIQAALINLGFHQQDIFDALAFAEGKGANAPHPFFEKALAVARKGEK